MSNVAKNLKAELAELKKRQAAIEDEIANAAKAERELEAEPFFEVAEKAHHLFCTFNHTDGCGWGYEQDASTKWGIGTVSGYSAHRRWLEKVMNISRELNLTPEELSELLDALTKLKKNMSQFGLVIRKLIAG